MKFVSVRDVHWLENGGDGDVGKSVEVHWLKGVHVLLIRFGVARMRCMGGLGRNASRNWTAACVRQWEDEGGGCIGWGCVVSSLRSLWYRYSRTHSNYNMVSESGCCYRQQRAPSHMLALVPLPRLQQHPRTSPLSLRLFKMNYTGLGSC